MPEFSVGVFDNPDYPNRKPTTYTRWFNSDWKGCCEHHVTAANGTAAKKLAITEHVKLCRVVKA